MKFSIIVPVYNGEEYLAQTLECLLAQSEKDIEIIVVNDGSTDSTQKLIDSFAAGDERIRPVYQDNAGVSAARNNGIECAQGEYIIFIDSDDLLGDGALEKLYAAMQSTSADLAIFRTQSFGSGVSQYNPIVDELIKLEEISCYDKRLLRNFIVSNKCYKADVLKNSSVRFPPMRYSEDGAFFMQFVHTVKPKITGVADALFMYRQHAGSVTHKVNASLISEFSKSMDFVYAVADDSFEDAPELKEEYLQELLFKDYLALMNEFYRRLWLSTDKESLELIGKRCAMLTSRMTDATKAKCAREIKDIGKPLFSKEEIAEKPFISVKVKNLSQDFQRELYAQSMPLFEVVDGSAKPKGKITLSFSGKEKLDPRLFKVVSLLKRSPKFGFLPDSLIKLGAQLFLKLKK
ncbi:MAG: glycosyltransferase family 2 protein [Clostridia bacterium]|nr:glycosyltransferase family 2 protein [Clostridia bacterium]